jgi:hypothetical protein
MCSRGFRFILEVEVMCGSGGLRGWLRVDGVLERRVRGLAEKEAVNQERKILE